jgi:hypothetical protein
MQAPAELRISAPPLLDVHHAIERLESRDEIAKRGRLLHRLLKDFIDSIVVEANAAGRSIAWIRATGLTEQQDGSAHQHDEARLFHDAPSRFVNRAAPVERTKASRL